MSPNRQKRTQQRGHEKKMKRATALKSIAQIVARLHSLSGIICTPHGSHDGVRIKRAWVFGSTAKGAESPRDIDILLDFELVGRYKDRARGHKNKGGTPCLDKERRRRYGINISIASEEIALGSLRKGLKMIRFHSLSIDGDIATPRIMLYPKNELPSS